MVRWLCPQTIVVVILDAKYIKVRQRKTWIMIVCRLEVIQCFFFLMKTHKTYLPFPFEKSLVLTSTQGYGLAHPQWPAISVRQMITLRLLRTEPS